MNDDGRSIGNILKEIVENVQGIIRSEVRLAKAEVREEGIKAGKASAVLGAGGVLGLYALGFLFLTCLYALEIAVAPWLAALIMTFLVGTGAAIAIGAGLKRIKGVRVRPEKTIDTMRENLEWAKNQTR